MSRHRETWIDPHGYFALRDRILLAVLVVELAAIAIGIALLLTRSSS